MGCKFDHDVQISAVASSQRLVVLRPHQIHILTFSNLAYLPEVHMCSNPRAPATQELQELSTGIPYSSACSPSRLVLSDHMQNSELY